MTLRPILDALDLCPGAARAASEGQSLQCHFNARAAARGVVSLPPEALRLAVRFAVAAGRDDLAEPVFETCARTRAYRILLPEGVFFVLVRIDTSAPVTIYSRDMMRAHRRGRKHRLRRTGSRARRHGADR